MHVIYNEIDPFAAEWLRNLIRADLIEPGIVDDTTITDQRVGTCSAESLARYRSRLGGQMFDIRVPLLTEPHRTGTPESSATIRKRVVAARARQGVRLREFGHRTNAEMSLQAVVATCRTSPGAKQALAELAWTNTPYEINQVLKVARTIADLHDIDDIGESAIQEAASYQTRIA